MLETTVPGDKYDICLRLKKVLETTVPEDQYDLLKAK